MTTPEADLDWLSIVHQGGRARSFSRMMPAFGDELTDAEIISGLSVLHDLRGWSQAEIARRLEEQRHRYSGDGALTASARDNGPAGSHLHDRRAHIAMGAAAAERARSHRR